MKEEAIKGLCALRSIHCSRVVVEQRLGRNQDAGEAITALAGLLVEKGLLQRVRRIRLSLATSCS